MQETQKTQVWSLGREDPLDEGLATPSRMPAWRIPWREEPGGLQTIGLQRVGHDWSDLAQSTHSKMEVSIFFFVFLVSLCFSSSFKSCLGRFLNFQKEKKQLTQLEMSILHTSSHFFWASSVANLEGLLKLGFMHKNTVWRNLGGTSQSSP